MTIERDPGTVEHELHEAMQVVPGDKLQEATGVSLDALYAFSHPHNPRKLPATVAARVDAALSRYGHEPRLLPLLETIYRNTLDRIGGSLPTGVGAVLPGIASIVRRVTDFAEALERITADGKIDRRDLSDLRTAYKSLSDLEVTVRTKRQRVYDLITALEDTATLDRRAS